jgi:hypothetical protein
MTIQALSEGLKLVIGAISALKQAKDLLPDGSEKDAAAKALEQAEQQFRIAEAQTAQGLGYPLCKCTFPPQIMLLTDQAGEYYRCPKCNREKDMTRRLPSVNATTRGRRITP